MQGRVPRGTHPAPFGHQRHSPSLSQPTESLTRPARSLLREARLRLPLRVLKQARFVVSLVAGHVDDEVPFDVLGLGAIASERER